MICSFFFFFNEMEGNLGTVVRGSSRDQRGGFPLAPWTGWEFGEKFRFRQHSEDGLSGFADMLAVGWERKGGPNDSIEADPLGGR